MLRVSVLCHGRRILPAISGAVISGEGALMSWGGVSLMNKVQQGDLFGGGIYLGGMGGVQGEMGVVQWGYLGGDLGVVGVNSMWGLEGEGLGLIPCGVWGDTGGVGVTLGGGWD